MSSGDDYVISKFGNFESPSDAIYGKGGFLEQLRDNQMEISLLKGKVAALTRSEMTRELPKEEGWYWFIPTQGEASGQLLMIHIVDRGLGLMGVTCPTEDDEYDYLAAFYDGLWSATPIPCDPMPKGGEE